MNAKFFLVAMLLAGVAACSQEAPPAPAGDTAATPPAPAVAPAPAKQVQPPIGDATLSINPGSFRICDAENGAITSTAKWDVTAKKIAEVSIYIVDPKGGKKLWLNGGATGESTTGNWVFPDTKFVMVERGSEKPLAELTVKASACN
jgi:hypothetical protein